MPSEKSHADIANILYPEVTNTPEYYEKKYPPRKLEPGAFVTRFAPSPTGFVHIGGIYASLISKRLAEQSDGVFYLRIEDTDQKREVEGGRDSIITTMKAYGVPPTEGYVDVDTESGEYGPYIQSQRTEIYSTYAKWLVEHDFAYPCFCTEEELKKIAEKQEKSGVKKKGYYGKWARDRHLTYDQVKAYLDAGKKFVLRVKVPEQVSDIQITDLIKGNLKMEGNSVDMVLIKSNKIPTYHFAHVVDDHLMRTTHVTRGEEWIPTTPLHVQLFTMFGFELPTFIHFSHIGKTEGNSIRKLSKRKDPESTMSFYTEKGYPADAVIEYLLNLANSNFYEWRKAHPNASHNEFKIDVRKIGKSIALFDQKKLDDMSKDVIARMSAEEVYEAALEWAKAYDPELMNLFTKYPEYSVKVFNIERQKQPPRKDIVNWSDLKRSIWYFFDELFDTTEADFPPLPKEVSKDAKKFVEFYVKNFDDTEKKEDWMEKSRMIVGQLGYARDIKTYKQSPESFKGHIGQLMAVLRIALAKSTNTPDLYEVMTVMGKERVTKRLKQAASKLFQ